MITYLLIYFTALPARSALAFELIEGVRYACVEFGPVGVHSASPAGRVAAEQPGPPVTGHRAVAAPPPPPPASLSLGTSARRTTHVGTTGLAGRPSRQVLYQVPTERRTALDFIVTNASTKLTQISALLSCIGYT